jgi:hypothetical protein
MWYINGRVESLPLTDMRYINGWVESIVLHRKVRDFFHTKGGANAENRVLYHKRQIFLKMKKRKVFVK